MRFRRWQSSTARPDQGALYRWAWRIILLSVLVVLAAEFAIMLILSNLGFSHEPMLALMDSLLLAAITLPALYYVVLRPVTARASEQAAAAARTRFETVAQTVKDGIVLYGWERKIEFANRAIEQIHGYPPGALLGADVGILMPVEVAEQFGKDMSHYQATSESPVIGKGALEFEAKRKNGERFPVELSVNPIGVGPDTSFVCIVRDIAERKRAQEALQQSERRLRQMLDALPVAVRIIQGGKIVFANPADGHLFGYERPAQEVGTDALADVAEEDLDRLKGYASQREAGLEAPKSYEAHCRRRDGTVFPAEIAAELFQYEGAPGSLVVLQDLTQRKRLQMYAKILPLCCVCGKIRDDTGVEHEAGAWGQLDAYLARHSDTRVSHSYCPDCYQEYLKKFELQ